MFNLFFAKTQYNMGRHNMSWLLYSTGIRRGELLQLKPGDIERDNMRIWIRGGKGKKDRYVQMGKSVLKFRDEYIGLFNPKEYLIEGLRQKYSAQIYSHVTDINIKNLSNPFNKL